MVTATVPTPRLAVDTVLLPAASYSLYKYYMDLEGGMLRTARSTEKYTNRLMENRPRVR